MAEFVDNYSDLKELGIDCDDNELDEKFNRAADYLPKLVSNLDNDTLLTLYAYYKQGKEGVCGTPKPSWFDFKGRSKWEAWKKLENMPQENAKALYINTIEKIDPDFHSQKVKQKETWVCVSTLQGETNLVDADKTVVDLVKENNREGVLSLLKREKYELNTLDENGLALIHWASDVGSVDILSDLLSYGADINSRDSEGQTALHYAASCGHIDCVRFLLSNGALIGIEDNDGLTAIDVANDEDIKHLFSTSV
ncbi:hypothetical protein HHI36_018567 [Cryptolaemus montrouzieri]|uniref:Acyl-CoA-binding domain-containing protein 6 n=1 Tax=Cryptolaemus montrouzieri TaxID=559131 RepID=A0ABD2P0B5_9CUCU